VSLRLNLIYLLGNFALDHWPPSLTVEHRPTEKLSLLVILWIQ